jgi:hypothetical protein
VKVVVPKLKRFDFKARKTIEETNVPREVSSAPVCCLADIPVIHLGYHSLRYGKIAIGFHRDAVIRHGFSPVLYLLHDSHVLNTIYRGFALLDEVSSNELETNLSSLDGEIADLECEHGHRTKADTMNMLMDLDLSISEVNRTIDAASKSVHEFLAFVKTFDQTEFNSIYCEREWRSTKSLAFEYSDISMIVVPRSKGDGDYHSRLLQEMRSIPILDGIPVVPWEDLIEY